MTLSGERREELVAAGQGHAVERFDALDDPSSVAQLAAELASLDLPLLKRLHALTRLEPSPATSFEPPDLFALRRTAEQAAQALAAIRAVVDPPAPRSVFQVPSNRLAHTGLERLSRTPVELVASLRSVNGVALVVARTVGHEGDEILVPCEARRLLGRELL